MIMIIMIKMMINNNRKGKGIDSNEKYLIGF